MQKRTTSLNEIIEKLRDETGDATVTVGEILKIFEHKGFGTLLLIPSLFLVLPTGAIPGAPIICGAVILLIAVQIICGRNKPWVPERIQQVKFKTSLLHKGLKWVTPAARFLDNYLGRRFTWLITPWSHRLIAGLCVVFAIVIMLVGSIPFAMLPPALAILFFALGLSVNDGLVIGVGLSISLLIATGGVYAVFIA